MPKTIYFPKDAIHTGIEITWVPSKQRLDVGGWYDTCVGIEDSSITLREFFDQLGIIEKDCAKAWKGTVCL